MHDGRDHWWHAKVDAQPADCEPEWVESEHPLFLLYTSGSTGKPKGIQHATAGYLTNATATNQWVFDLGLRDFHQIRLANNLDKGLVQDLNHTTRYQSHFHC